VPVPVPVPVLVRVRMTVFACNSGGRMFMN